MGTNLTHQQVFGYFRMGLAIGIVERQAVIAWADRALLEDPSPSSELIELLLAGHKPYSQLIRLLSSFVPSPDYDVPLKLLFAHAEMLLEEEPNRASDLFVSLRLLDAEEYLPREVRASLADLAVVFDQFVQGQLSIQAIYEQLSRFLRRFDEWMPAVQAIYRNKS